MVSEARKHNIRLILPLCNNWKDYGGKSQYIKWGQSSGLDLTSDDEFFSNDTLKDYYKAFVEVSVYVVLFIISLKFQFLVLLYSFNFYFFFVLGCSDKNKYDNKYRI